MQTPLTPFRGLLLLDAEGAKAIIRLGFPSIRVVLFPPDHEENIGELRKSPLLSTVPRALQERRLTFGHCILRKARRTRRAFCFEAG